MRKTTANLLTEKLKSMELDGVSIRANHSFMPPGKHNLGVGSAVVIQRDNREGYSLDELKSAVLDDKKLTAALIEALFAEMDVSRTGNNTFLF